MKPLQLSASLMLSPPELGHHPAVLCWPPAHPRTHTHKHTNKNKCMLAGKHVHATTNDACCYVHRSRPYSPTHTHIYTQSYTVLLCFIFININLNSCECSFPLRPPCYSTSKKKKHAHTHEFTHMKNVGHAGRIYSRLQNTGRKLFSFNLFLPLLVYGGLDKTKVTRTGSFVNCTSNKAVA